MQGTTVENSVYKKTAFRRHLFETAGWIVAIALLWGVDLVTKFAERERTGFGKVDFRLISEQLTSGLAVLLMIPFVIYWVRLFPLRRDGWLAASVGHVVGTVIFAFGHFSLIVLFRIMVMALYKRHYVWMQDYVSNLLVEYQKDIKIYLGIVLVISAYQYYRQHRLEPSHPDAYSHLLPNRSSEKSAASRLIVQTGSGESVVRYEDIYYLEACRNYVAVHTQSKEYLVRDTIQNLEKLLPSSLFARCHRSFIVNIDVIVEIKSADGSYQITLDNKKSIPLSRRYRDVVKSALAN